MATVNIGNIKLNWKGAYNGSTSYAIDDVVSYNGSSYVCIQASTGNLPTVTAYWEQMSQKGTDADLINITGTVQGDLYYNNGSAIARLGAGTSGQVLQTGGSGANPSWTNVSSDFVKLETQEVTSSVGSVTFKGFANSIYGSYELQCSDVQKSGSTDHRLNFRWHINNSNVTTSGYRATFHGQHFNNIGSTNENYGGNWSSDHIQLTNWNMPDTRNSGEQVRHLSMTITNLSNASYNPVIHYQQISPHPSGTYTNHDVGGGYHVGSETRIAFGANDGFTLFPEGDQIGKGIFTLYGRKK